MVLILWHVMGFSAKVPFETLAVQGGDIAGSRGNPEPSPHSSAVRSSQSRRR